MVGPVPGQLEGPQQGDRLPQIPHTGEHQIGVPQHQKEHGEEKGEKSVSERLAFHPFGDVFPAGQPEAPAQQPKQLAPAAVAVAVALGPADHGDDEGDEEAQQAQPGKQNVEKSQQEVQERSDPQIVVPVLLHASTSRILMTLAGHSLAHLPQPTHLSCRTWAITPRTISMACRGQTFTQQPQATQADGSTTALRRFFTEFIACLPKLSGFIIPHIYELHRDEITNAAGRIAPHAPA